MYKGGGRHIDEMLKLNYKQRLNK